MVAVARRRATYVSQREKRIEYRREARHRILEEFRTGESLELSSSDVGLVVDDGDGLGNILGH